MNLGEMTFWKNDKMLDNNGKKRIAFRDPKFKVGPLWPFI